MKLVNLTVHPLKIYTSDTEFRELPIGGDDPFVVDEHEDLCTIAGGIPIARRLVHGPHGLPPVEDDVILVVPEAVAEHPAVASREDLAYPGLVIQETEDGVVSVGGLQAGPGLANKLRKRNAAVGELSAVYRF